MIDYSWPFECTNFKSWLFKKWDTGDHWCGPYNLYRRAGFRFFGIEIEWVYLQKPDRYYNVGEDNYGNTRK